jgi:putative ABC transport system ATP-binding protein
MLSENHDIIQLENINKRYGSDETEVLALHDVSLTIEAGAYCGIMDQPSSGEYYLDGQAVAQLDDDELAYIRNLKLGFVFQQFHLLAQLDALENVMLPMTYAGVSGSEREERAVEALTRVGLANRLHNRPNQLSGGQQQRVAIARAIVNQPVLLLADEPTGALDTRTGQEVMEIFQDLNAGGMTVVMVTHSSEVACQCHRIIWFRDGEVIHGDLTPADLTVLAS